MKKVIITIVIILIMGTIIFLFSQKDTSVAPKITPAESSKLLTTCNSDLDCQDYLSINTCEVVCVAKNETNKKIIDNYPITCDATLWDRYFVDCRCIENNCQVAK